MLMLKKTVLIYVFRISLNFTDFQSVSVSQLLKNSMILTLSLIYPLGRTHQDSHSDKSTRIIMESPTYRDFKIESGRIKRLTSLGLLLYEKLK